MNYKGNQLITIKYAASFEYVKHKLEIKCFIMADVINFYRTIRCENEVTVLETWTTVWLPGQWWVDDLAIQTWTLVLMTTKGCKVRQKVPTPRSAIFMIMITVVYMACSNNSRHIRQQNLTNDTSILFHRKKDTSMLFQLSETSVQPLNHDCIIQVCNWLYKATATLSYQINM